MLVAILSTYESMHHHDILFKKPGLLPLHDAPESISSRDVVQVQACIKRILVIAYSHGW